jgi:hypothetical protein
MAQSSMTNPWPDPFTAKVIVVVVAALSGTPWAGH